MTPSKRDPALVPDLFEEVLRFDTPVQMVFRQHHPRAR
jgi:cytochrome P450